MSESNRNIEELLKVMTENNQKVNLYKLEADEHGRYLLDPNNPHHRAWVENDDEYEVVDHSE
jgi:hypothetical protein